MQAQDKGSGQAQAIDYNVDTPKKNHFYALRYMSEQESSLDVVTGMLQSSLLMYMFYLIRVLRYLLLLPR